MFKIIIDNQQCQVVFPSPVEAVAQYCDEYICVCVCVSTRISPDPHAQSLPNHLCMLPMAVARFSSGVIAVSYVLPVLCMTSLTLCFSCTMLLYSGMNFTMKDQFRLNLLI